VYGTLFAAGLCVVIGLGSPLIVPALDHAVAAWAPELAPRLPVTTELAPLGTLALVYAPLLALTAIAAVWLSRRPRARADVGTWDCGYAAPTPRMQYTASSFAQMLVGTFTWALRPEVKRPELGGAFPTASRFHSEVPDAVLDRLLVPATRSVVDEQRRWTTWMQRGTAHAYLLYIVITLVLLLLWKGG